jgi:hypothetical protein
MDITAVVMFNFDQSLMSVLNALGDTATTAVGLNTLWPIFQKMKVRLFVVTMEKISRERVNSHTIN